MISLDSRVFSRNYPSIFLLGDELHYQQKFYRLDDGVFDTPIGKFTKKRLEDLFALNTSLPPKYWHLIDIEYADDDANNEDPKNIIPIFPKEGIEHEKYPGFYYIPFYSGYVINRDGEVIRWSDGKRYRTLTNGHRYCFYRIQRDLDGVKHAALRHRLLAYTFYPYPKTVRSLDVNHINGVRGDDRLENLEWATRQQNCIHAYSTGLRSDNVPVVIKSIYTGEEVTFYSYAQAAKAINTCIVTIFVRVASEGQKVFFPGILVKKVSCTKPWLTNFEQDYWGGLGTTKRLVLRKDGRTIVVYSYYEAYLLTGVNRVTIAWRLKNWGKTVDLNGYTATIEGLELENRSLMRAIACLEHP